VCVCGVMWSVCDVCVCVMWCGGVWCVCVCVCVCVRDVVCGKVRV